MRILYISADPGICIDEACGAGSHIQETVKALNILGHQVFLAASDCNPGIPERLPGKRIRRHCWFSALSNFRNSSSEDKPADRKPGIKAETVSVSNRVADSPFAKKEKKKNETKCFRRKLSEIYYGPFRHYLNRLEETTVYRKRFTKQVSDIMDSFLPDAVYERYALGHHGILALCNNRRIPHILEVNALLAKEAIRQERLPIWEKQSASRDELNFLRNADTVFVVSDHIKNSIGSNQANIVLHPNGVDINAFTPDIDPERTRKRHAWKDTPLLGWVGSFGHSRGVEDFLLIADRIHQLRPDIHFLIIGDGPLKNWVDNQVKELGIEEVTTLTGKIPKETIPEYIAAMDITSAPYPAHGAEYFSPLKVFEYMAAGKPVAATSVGQCIDLLKEGAGLLLPPEQPNVWANEIISLLDDAKRREEMGRVARERVIENYTWTRNAERIVTYMEKLQQKINGKS